jgi:hypothetical protein
VQSAHHRGDQSGGNLRIGYPAFPRDDAKAAEDCRTPKASPVGDCQSHSRRGTSSRAGAEAAQGLFVLIHPALELLFGKPRGFDNGACSLRKLSATKGNSSVLLAAGNSLAVFSISASVIRETDQGGEQLSRKLEQQKRRAASRHGFALRGLWFSRATPLSVPWQPRATEGGLWNNLKCAHAGETRQIGNLRYMGASLRGSIWMHRCPACQ